MVDTEKLAEVANRINQKSDDLQTTLQKIQDKINGLNIGLEVWLSNPILSRETPSIVTDRRCTLDVYLGYAKTFSGWGLVSQEKVYSQSLGDDDEWIHDSCNEAQPLLKSSRAIRIAALKHLQELIDEIVRSAENSINEIEKAKLLADEM